MLKIDEENIQEFKDSLRGELIQPGDTGYDDARKIWNGMIDKRPALIARCTGVTDVIEAVNFARSNNLLVAVRGGGHNVAGNAVCDGGIVIDMSRMKGIWIDPKARTARALAGLTWGEFDRETQVFGLATTGGLISTTGIAGLTLGGGIGWLMGKYGLACDNLLSADVITADGRFLVASKTENADLFWGLRGGGGNFGIVTSFEYRLHPVGQIIGGAAVYPVEKAREVLRFYREYTKQAPDELTTYAFLFTPPDSDPVVAIFLCYAGPLEDGEQLVKPVKEFGSPIMDTIGTMPYTKLQSMIDKDPANLPGLQNYWKSDFLKGLGDEFIDMVIDHFSRVPSPLSSVYFEHIHGAVSRVGPNDTPFGHRDADYNFLIQATWTDPTESDQNIKWARDFWTAIQPFSTGGTYLNYLGKESENRIRAAYGAANYERLVALKNKYDPTNFFSLNQNIKPRK